MVSAARPKANYPFTTLTPMLGVVSLGEGDAFVMADIPGIIEGAHQGVGLGTDFLRHIERTRLLIHMVDAAGVDGRDPVEDYYTINRELELYSSELAKRPQIVVANKCDLPEAGDNLARLAEAEPKDGRSLWPFRRHQPGSQRTAQGPVRNCARKIRCQKRPLRRRDSQASAQWGAGTSSA